MQVTDAMREALIRAANSESGRVGPQISEALFWSLRVAGLVNDSGWLTPEGKAELIGHNVRVQFHREGVGLVEGTVRSIVHDGGRMARVIVFSPALGHTHRIDHGCSVEVSEIYRVTV